MRLRWYKSTLESAEKNDFGDTGVLVGKDYAHGVPDDDDGANLTSSLGTDGLHYPALDFDFPSRLEESHTPGHHHLYIDKGLTFEQYSKLLAVLNEVGLIEDGVYASFKKSGMTMLRTKEALPYKNPNVTSSTLSGVSDYERKCPCGCDTPSSRCPCDGCTGAGEVF